MMDIRTIRLHAEFPEKTWVIVEQPRHVPYRFNYDPVTNTFTATSYKSLFYDRGFSGVYGWIGGLGAPPDPHFDVMVLTRQDLHPGDLLAAYICGVFFRGDGDHKFVAMDEEFRQKTPAADLAALDQATYAELRRLYPNVGENEGWFGAEIAQNHLKHHQPEHD